MKIRLLYIAALICTSLSMAQVSEIVDETWHLRSITIDDQISYAPYTQNFNLNFTGSGTEYEVSANGVENTLLGSVTFNESNQTLQFTEVSVTLLDCNSENCDIEETYFFSFFTDEALTLKAFDYFYFEFTSGAKSLKVTDALGNTARYFNTPITPPNPALFQTFYLHAMDTDLGPTTQIEAYDPPVQPTITIQQDLSFTGVGSCNTFSGEFAYTHDDFSGGYLIPTAFEAGSTPCENHNELEEYYFFQFEDLDPLSFLAGGTTNPGNGAFSFERFAGFTFHFENQPVLSVPEFNTAYFSIYPVPADDMLYINTSKGHWDTLSIVSINGQHISQINEFQEGIDVSALKAGIYFVRITNAAATSTHRFIKK